MYTFFEKSHLKKCGADVLDCLGVSEFLYDAKTDISEYFTDDIDGHLRLDYLKKHRRGTYTTLLTTCKLNEHLADIDAEASQCVRELTEAFAKAEGIAEQLKATNNLLWAKEMNNCKARAEEIVLREVVFR